MKVVTYSADSQISIQKDILMLKHFNDNKNLEKSCELYRKIQDFGIRENNCHLEPSRCNQATRSLAQPYANYFGTSRHDEKSLTHR